MVGSGLDCTSAWNDVVQRLVSLSVIIIFGRGGSSSPNEVVTTFCLVLEKFRDEELSGRIEGRMAEINLVDSCVLVHWIDDGCFKVSWMFEVSYFDEAHGSQVLVIRDHLSELAP